MRLVRLTLKNICQHADLDWEFGDGLIGVYGPVGSGKSNAMLTATYVALSGRYDRHPSGKAGLLKRGEIQGSIRLIISCAAQLLTIEVLLTAVAGGEPSSKITLQYKDGNKDETVTGASQVYTLLRERFKLEGPLLDEYVFVRQQALNDLLVQTPAERIKTLGRLCGTERAEVVHRALSDRTNSLGNVLTGMDWTADDTQTALRQNREAYRNAKSAYAAARDKVKQLPAARRAKLRQIVDSPEQHRTSAAAAAKAKEAKVAAALQAKQVTAEVEEFAKRRSRAFNVAKTYKLTAAEFRDTWQTYCEARRAVAARRKQQLEIRKLTKLIASAASPDAPSSPAFSDAADASRQRDALIAAMAATKSLIGLDGKPTCPTCGTEAEVLSSKILAAKKKAPKQTATLAEIDKYLAACSQHAAALREYKATRGQRQQRLQELKAAMPPKISIPTISASKVRANGVAAVAAFREARQAYVAVNRKLQTAKQRAAECRGAVAATAAAYTAAKAAVVEASPQSEVEAAAVKLRKHRQRRAQARKLWTAYEVARQLYLNSKEAHERASSVRARRQKLLKWQERLNRCRDYMHRNGLPRAVHAAALALLQERINPLLADLDAPFEVRANSTDASLMAVMQDGEEFPTAALSGGQTVSLSIAYRLAVKETFASHFDTLVLDEPTSWLDERRMDRLVDTMQRLRRRARRLGQQIIIVSHSDRLRRVFDTVLET